MAGHRTGVDQRRPLADAISRGSVSSAPSFLTCSLVPARAICSYWPAARTICGGGGQPKTASIGVSVISGLP